MWEKKRDKGGTVVISDGPRWLYFAGLTVCRCKKGRREKKKVRGVVDRVALEKKEKKKKKKKKGGKARNRIPVVIRGAKREEKGRGKRRRKRYGRLCFLKAETADEL